jgi:hypothetical protein
MLERLSRGAVGVLEDVTLHGRASTVEGMVVTVADPACYSPAAMRQ